MIWVYIASAIFGGIFVVPMILGGLDLDSDVDFDMDTDVDVGADLDVGADMGGDVGGGDGVLSGVGDFAASLFSFRSIVMAVMFFGLSGILFTLLDTGAALVFVTAVLLGLFAAAVNSSIMRYVLNREASSHVTMNDVRGIEAEVTLPLSLGRKGRVRAIVAGQTESFVALPFGEKHGDREFGIGERVVIVEVNDGTALVSPIRSLE